jgi:hypothetical protein
VFGLSVSHHPNEKYVCLASGRHQIQPEYIYTRQQAAECQIDTASCLAMCKMVSPKSPGNNRDLNTVRGHVDTYNAPLVTLYRGWQDLSSWNDVFEVHSKLRCLLLNVVLFSRSMDDIELSGC